MEESRSMRAELRTEASGLRAEADVMQTRLTVLRAEAEVMQTRVAVLRSEAEGMHIRLGKCEDLCLRMAKRLAEEGIVMT